MPGEDTITMAQHELRRLHVIRKAIDQVITQKDASEVIGSRNTGKYGDTILEIREIRGHDTHL